MLDRKTTTCAICGTKGGKHLPGDPYPPSLKFWHDEVADGEILCRLCQLGPNHEETEKAYRASYKEIREISTADLESKSRD